MSKHKRMNPMSGEQIDVDGVYANEWGREEMLKMGDTFPADPQLGSTAWELVSFPVDNESLRHTVDPELRNESDERKNRSRMPHRPGEERGDQ